MILAVAAALAGCGDDGAASDAGGSTGASTSGSTSSDDSTPTSATTSGAGSTTDASDGSSSSSSGNADTGSSDATGSSDSGDSTGAESSSSTGSIETVTISGNVTDFGTPMPLVGIEVCVFEQDGIPCATTDDVGDYTLAGVPIAEGAIEFTGAGRFPSLFWGEGPMEGDVLDYNLLSTIGAAVLAAVLGEEIDETAGHLALAVTGPDGSLLEGAQFTVTPDSGVVGYLTPDGIDPKLTTTSQVGFAGWLNVDVGEVEVTVTHPDFTCVPGPGALIGSTPEALRIDVTAGYLGSTFPFVCN
ncbi:MAG: hypothetical protein AAGA54_07310 [Myxococcota bacterium]